MFVRLRYFRFVAALATLTSLAACSKDDPKPAANPMGMSWTVDGNNVTATTTNKDASGTEILIAGIAGTQTNSSAILLNVPKVVGTYTITSGSDTGAAYQTIMGTTDATYNAESGTITVTSLTATNIAGTFTFTGEGEDSSGATKPAKTISNGKFNIAL